MNNDLSKLSKEKLMGLVTAMAWNDSMGCHTRAGFEKWIWPEIYPQARFLVYFDVDRVHQINEHSGSYAAFDTMIKRVLSTVRSTDIVSGQWFSGDEYVICVTDQRPEIHPEGLINRLTEELAAQGLSAIFAHCTVHSPVLSQNVNPLSDKVLELKAARGVSR